MRKYLPTKKIEEQFESVLGISIEKYKIFDSSSKIKHDFAQTFRICFDNVISEFDQRTFDSCEEKNFALCETSIFLSIFRKFFENLDD
jgi:hypothetical protein